ncbi:MAG: hypothetical protein RLZZ574_1402 [Cyanobacteriota bacterium]|jgi:hypothetical protein
MESQPMFTNFNLQGTYAFSGTGWGGQSPLSSIGILTFDGQEKVTGFTWQNLPGDQFGERKFLELPVKATYTVNANGTGTTRSAEDTDPEMLLAIAKTSSLDGTEIVQEFSFVLRQLEPVTGNLFTAIAKRLPNDGEFNNASLSGTYVGAAVGRGGQTPGAGFGILTYDGNGGFSESNISNVQVGLFRERAFVTGSDQGIYTVNGNGTGTVAGGGVVFVITKAEVVNGIKRALEYAFIVADLVPTNGSHFTGISKRRSV